MLKSSGTDSTKGYKMDKDELIKQRKMLQSSLEDVNAAFNRSSLLVANLDEEMAKLSEELVIAKQYRDAMDRSGYNIKRVIAELEGLIDGQE